MLRTNRNGAVRKVMVMTGSVGPASNRRGADEFGWVSFADKVGPQPIAVPLFIRLKARLFADLYDGKLVAGVVPTPGTALAVHARRLVTVAERETVARSFSSSLREARKPLSPWTARSWTHRPNLLAAAPFIDAVTLHLHSPRPVDAVGMAKLRQLLSDGTGPLYTSGRGDLATPLRAALSAL